VLGFPVKEFVEKVMLNETQGDGW